MGVVCMSSEGVEKFLKALAHPVRRTIIRALAEKGRLSYTELMRLTGVEDSGTFAFHIKVLQGLIEKDGETGDYRLTSDGWRAYRVLEILTGREEEFKEKAVEEPSGEKEVVVVQDRISFTLSKSLAEKLRREGKRILIRDVVVVDIEDMPEDLLDEVLEGIYDVLSIRVSKDLQHIVELKSHDVLSVGGSTGFIGGIVKGIVEGVVKAASIASSLKGEKNIHAVRSVEVKEKPYSLDISSDASSMSIESGGEDLLVVEGDFYRQEDLDLKVRDGGVYVAVDEGNCVTRVPSGLERLSIDSDASAIKVYLDSVDDLIMRMDASSLIVSLSKQGVSRIKLDGESSSIDLSVSYVEYEGESFIELDLDTSSLKLLINIPEKTAIDAKIIEGYGVIEVNGLSVQHYRDKGYEEASSKLCIRVRNSSGASKIYVNRKCVGQASP